MLRDRKKYKSIFTLHQWLILLQIQYGYFYDVDTIAWCTGLSKRQVHKKLKELYNLNMVFNLPFSKFKDINKIRPLDHFMAVRTVKDIIRDKKASNHKSRLLTLNHFDTKLFWKLTVYGHDVMRALQLQDTAKELVLEKNSIIDELYAKLDKPK